jgi:hypothetical protein
MARDYLARLTPLSAGELRVIDKMLQIPYEALIENQEGWTQLREISGTAAEIGGLVNATFATSFP